MRITFDRDFDAGAWPGALHARDAVAGEAWVGELGLLGLLETALGSSAPWESATARAAALVPAVRTTDGFWSRSAELDPLGAARTLLAWRDELRMHGWRGDVATGRLGALASVTASVPPGVPDRWEAVAEALASRRAEVESLRLFEPLAELPAAIRRVIGRLVEQGTVVGEEVPPVAAGAGDLASARRGRFAPQGDGSLQLLRAHGPLQAAEDVAAWLAAAGDLAGTVIVGGEPVLDAALLRHGLPATGAAGAPADNALLQLLPLVLALGWQPPDPQRALELLTLQQGPVPRAIARRLVEALHEHPAVGSDRWNEALAEGVARIEDPERRERVRERLAWLFAGTVSRAAGYEAVEVSRRVAPLQQWLQGRLAVADDPAPWSAAVAQCTALARLVQLAGLSRLPESILHRFVEEASRSAGALPAHEAGAGLAAVGAPGGLVAPARRVVWWNFTRASAPAVETLPLSREERAALERAGIRVPAAGALASRLAARWRRPLLAASEALLLVCPERDAGGGESHPHPLWDEIGALADGGAARLVRRAPAGVRRERRQPLARTAPRRTWNLPQGAVAARATESPSSLGLLVGCSLAWALQYAAKLRTGAVAALPQAEQLAGKTVHAILAELLAGPEMAPDEAAAAARRLFEEKGPKLAAALFLPGADGARAKALRATEEAARELFRLFRNGRFRVVSVETPFRKPALGTELEGTPDLVVEGPDGARFPVDLKWSGTSYRRKSLESGSAYQLAAYAHLVGGDFAPAQDGAYFILTDQRLLTCRDDVDGGRSARGPAAEESWRAAAAAHGEQLVHLRAGTAVATAIAGDDGESPVDRDGLDEEGRLVLGAPCRFCDYAALCGRTFGGN